MEEKQVKKLPPFSHIKVLENGYYGCTLLVVDKIYNGVFSPDWECIEKLHLVEVDAYADFDHKLKDGLNPMLDKDRIDIIYDNDEELAKGLILNFEEENTKEDEKENPLALFSSQYINPNGDIALTIDNTLLPYKYFIPSFLENIFFKFACCGCTKLFASSQLCWNKIQGMFGVSLFSNDPFDNALKQVIKEYQTLDDLAFDIVDEKYPDVDVADPQFEDSMWEEMEKLEASFRERLADGAYDFCYSGYLQYLKDNCPDLLDDLP